MHIGIAGVGTMGSNIGARLMEVGRKLTVWNRSAEKTKPIADAGASVAKTPAELASAVDVVITILTNAEAIDAVYLGPQGLLAGDLDAGLGQFPAARRVDVIADDMPTGRYQIAGERAAHDAEADNTDRLLLRFRRTHSISSSLR